MVVYRLKCHKTSDVGAKQANVKESLRSAKQQYDEMKDSVNRLKSFSECRKNVMMANKKMR